jgi:cyclase
MLKRRLIPKLLTKKSSVEGTSDFEVFTSQRYSNLKLVGSLRSQLSIFESNRVDELLVINVEKTTRSFDDNFVAALRDSIEALTTPIMVGGGINSINDASKLVGVGVDKVLCGISTLNHRLHEEIAYLFGSQALSVSIDYSIEGDCLFVGFTQQLDYSLDSFKSLVLDIENSGAGEIILNRIDSDGMRQGLDIETLQEVLSVATVPIVVSSGAGKPEHFIDAFESGADGISVGTYFAKMDQSPLQLRSRLVNAGINLRA